MIKEMGNPIVNATFRVISLPNGEVVLRHEEFKQERRICTAAHPQLGNYLREHFDRMNPVQKATLWLEARP